MTSTDHSLSNRESWLDYAKAIGMALVVFGHANRTLAGADPAAWNAAHSVADQVIYTFHMPLFFIISGYVSQSAAAKPLQGFLRGLLWGAVVPYVAWTTIWVVAKSINPGLAHHPVGLADLLSIAWQPVEHFWFLHQLIIVRVLWYAIERFAGPLNGSVFALILIAGSGAAGSMALTAGPAMPWSALTLVDFSFFGFGLLILPAFLKWAGDREAMLMLAAAAVWTCVMIFNGGSAGAASYVLLAMLASAAILLASRMLPEANTPALRTLAFLGEASLAIYVLHLFVITVIRIGFAAGLAQSGASFLAVATIAGLVVPALTYWVALRFGAALAQPIAKWVGFGPAMRSHYLSPVQTIRPMA